MDKQEPDFVLRYLAEVEALAEEVMAGRRQELCFTGFPTPERLCLTVLLACVHGIVDLDQKRNQNREALRALGKESGSADKVMVCFGSMFVQLPKMKTKDMLQRDQELLDEEIGKLREELKVKVNRLLEAQGKPELKGYSLKPLSTEEVRFIQKVLEG